MILLYHIDSQCSISKTRGGGLSILKLRTNRHSVHCLQYHLVVVTKYRKEVINEDINNELIAIAKNIFEVKNKGKVIEINTDKDHIHILFSVGPQVQLSKLINSFKTVSSKLVRKKFATYVNSFYWKPYFWSKSYFICSLGHNTEEIVPNYIKNQKQFIPINKLRGFLFCIS